MPAIAKILDKIINKRMQYWLEQKEKIDTKQYGYREGISTLDAVQSLIETIRKNKTEGYHQLIVALDLKNAFNNSWNVQIMYEIEKAEIGEKLGNICQSFLKDRQITAGTYTTSVNRGCPQGSSLGPTLWIVMMQGWFRALHQLNSEINANTTISNQETIDSRINFQAFADDQMIIIKGKSAKEIEKV